jgi:predicted RNA-binding protein
MCDLNAVVLKSGKEELILENVDLVKVEDGKIYLRSLFGEERVFEGKLKEVHGTKRKLILEPS